jgi:hypothetical protein
MRFILLQVLLSFAIIINLIYCYPRDLVRKRFSSLEKTNTITKSILYATKDLERIESLKVATVSALFGSIIGLPLFLLTGFLNQFNANWEIQHDYNVIVLVLFGITYRYANRETDEINVNQQQGIVGAFAVTRALSLVQASPICSSIPINCGEPFTFFTIDMFVSGLISLIEYGLNYYLTSIMLNYLFDKKLLKRLA